MQIRFLPSVPGELRAIGPGFEGSGLRKPGEMILFFVKPCVSHKLGIFGFFPVFLRAGGQTRLLPEGVERGRLHRR